MNDDVYRPESRRDGHVVRKGILPAFPLPGSTNTYVNDPALGRIEFEGNPDTALPRALFRRQPMCSLVPHG